MKEGPFKQAIELEKDDVIKEEYVVYRNRDNYIVKETYARTHYRHDFHDTSTIEPLVKA
tara:strand:- start:251 stop:427 length:177 start_codon:yes stop_codon:yes gene_type:complete